MFVQTVVVTTTIRLRFDCDSTAVRLPFDCNSTALRPFDDLHHDCRPTCVCIRDVHGNGIPNGTGNPMGIPWEWE